MDGSIGEHTFGGYGNGSEISFTHEERQPGFLGNYSPAQTQPMSAHFGRESPYGANMNLDMRLENDKLRTELMNAKSDLEAQVVASQRDCITACLLAIEVERLQAVIGDLGAKTATMQTFLEEATRTAGDSSRIKELELQLDNLLSTNQRNLEALKFKKLSLDKSRRRVEQLQAENILLKMALEAAVLSSGPRESKKDTSEIDRWRVECEKLQERYKLLEKQNIDQGQFAKELDLQVSQLTKYIQDNRERILNFESLKEENQQLVSAFEKDRQTIDQLHDTIRELKSQLNQAKLDALKTTEGEAKEAWKDEQILDMFQSMLSGLSNGIKVATPESEFSQNWSSFKDKVQSLKQSIDNLNHKLMKDLKSFEKLQPQHSMKQESSSGDSIKEEVRDLSQMISQTIEALITNSQNQKAETDQSIHEKPIEHEARRVIDDLRRENEHLRNQVKQQALENEERSVAKQSVFDSFSDQERSGPRRETSDTCQSCQTTTATSSRFTSLNQQAVISKLTEQLALSNSHCEQISSLNEDLRRRVADLESSKEQLRNQLSSLKAASLEASQQDPRMQIEAAEAEASKLAEECCLLRARLIDAEEAMAGYQKEAENGRMEIATLRLQITRLENGSSDHRMHSEVETDKLRMTIEDLQSHIEASDKEINRLQRERLSLLEELDVKSVETRKLVEQTRAECLKEHQRQTDDLERQLFKDFEKRETDLRAALSEALEKEISENFIARFREYEAREKAKLEKASSVIKSLENQVKDATERAQILEAELQETLKAKETRGEAKQLPESADKLSDSGTLEIEDMRAFVRDLKQEANYQSEGREIRELKETNRQLMNQLVKAEQATLDQLNHSSCQQERDELLAEVNRLQQELTEVEKTCRHMRDRLSAQDQNKSKAAEEPSQRLRQLEHENDKLKKTLRQAVPASSVCGWLSSIVAAFSSLRKELDHAKTLHRDLEKMFVSRMHSLRSLFGTEAELAPRGTLAQIVKLKEYNSNGANKLQSTLERVCEQLATTRAEVGHLKSDLAKAKTEAVSAKTEVRKVRAQLDDTEKTAERLVSELEKARNEAREEREAKDRERRLREVGEIEMVRKADNWQEERAREREAQRILKEVISEREEAIEGLKADKDKLGEEMHVIIRKLEDSESRRREVERTLNSMSSELKQTKNMLREYSHNKENIRNNENTLASRVKDLESTVEMLTEKLEKKNKELMQLKNSDSKKTLKESSTKPTDRVAVIRNKIELLFDKMSRTLTSITEAESMLYQNPSQGKGLSPVSSKTMSTPLATSFQGELEALIHAYESLGKKYVNEAIDVCQQSLRVFEGMQSAHHRLCPKLAKIH